MPRSPGWPWNSLGRTANFLLFSVVQNLTVLTVPLFVKAGVLSEMLSLGTPARTGPARFHRPRRDLLDEASNDLGGRLVARGAGTIVTCESCGSSLTRRARWERHSCGVPATPKLAQYVRRDLRAGTRDR